jgi:glycine/D-amino acid oxidase-like deaminating enzyme
VVDGFPSVPARGSAVRVAVVGGGIAGTALAWRLASFPHHAAVDLFTGGAAGPDATGVSGGLVRGFEIDRAMATVAIDGLAELLDSRLLREWAGYREVGSLYLLPATPDVDITVALMEARIPGSAWIATAAEVRCRYPFRDLPDGTVGVVERRAGFISPDRLRNALLDAASRSRVTLRTGPVAGVTPAPAVRLLDGRHLRYDAVVLAAGSWTPRLLARSGLPVGGLRTKHVQYILCTVDASGLGSFVDADSGLYGRPTSDGRFLLGLPSDRWDVRPDAVRPDPELAARTLAIASERLALPAPPNPPPPSFAAADCYSTPPGLALRPVVPDSRLSTFTGGSGGAAKSALASSRAAAAALLGVPSAAAS